MNHRAGRPHGRPARPTPWPRGEARACKARTRQFESARCLSSVGDADADQDFQLVVSDRMDAVVADHKVAQLDATRLDEAHL